MTGLTSRQRKIIYLVIIAALLAPINFLGRPSSQTTSAGPGQKQEDVDGGILAELRHDYDLGESNLGDVDPSSATMNLVLVGLRGIAANTLWMDAIKNQEQKNWAALENNVKSIILLQPHFVKVWEFQGWNLAYNVSAEWDLVQDKYHWIKEGAKFSIRGTQRNANNAELYWWVGVILGDKIARHDAWMYMRKFFNPQSYDEKDPLVGDPAIRDKTNNEEISPDKQLNPEDKDNYLVAKEWFLKANDADNVDGHRQKRMARIAFRQRPAKSHMAYAEMLQREGRFDEQSTMLAAWRTGLKNWIDKYDEGNRPGLGQEKFTSVIGGLIRVGVDTSDSQQLEALKRLDGIDVDRKLTAISTFRSIINYNYWKTRATIEGQESTVRSHKYIYDGKQALFDNKLDESIRLLEQGLEGFAKLLIKYPDLYTGEESIAEVVMIGVIAWRDARKLLGVAESGANDLPWRNEADKRALYQALNRLQQEKQGQMEEFLKIYRRDAFKAKK